eukprot:m.77940 g.77940  ORF g.77940 m.77940 type:complete len:660 (-) comp11935_c0_seq1:63-2042(-)
MSALHETIKEFIGSKEDVAVPQEVSNGRKEAADFLLHEMNALLDAKNHVHVARFCALVAEVCKDEESRNLLTEEATVMEGIHKALFDASAEYNMDVNPASCVEDVRLGVVTQCLRSIGNLCFDNDKARTHLRATGGIAALAEALKCLIKFTTSNNPNKGTEKKIAEEEETEEKGEGKQTQPQTQRNNCSFSLIQQLPGSLSTAAPGSILNASGEMEDLLKELIQAGVVKSLMWMLGQASLGEMERSMTFQALMRFSAEEEALKDIASEEGVDALIGTLEQCEDEEDAGDISNLFQRIAKKDELLVPFSNPARVDRLIGIALNDKVHKQSRTVAAVTVSILLSNDTVLDSHMWIASHRQRTLDMLMGWMMDADNHDMNVAGLVGIGNICRSDENARILGEVDGLLQAVIACISHKFSFVQHPALGTLKNLVKLKENKFIAIKEGCLPVLKLAANDPQAPIQYLVCSLLRSLCTVGGDEGKDVLQQLARDDVFIERIVHLSKSEVAAARCEAMRLVAEIIKTSRDSAIVGPLVLEQNALDVLTRMLDEEHIILAMECSVALVIVSAMLPCREALLGSGVVEKSLEKVQNTPQIEFALNFMSMYLQLCMDSDIVASELGKSIISCVKNNFSEHENSIAQQQAAKVLAAATTVSSGETKTNNN